MMATHSSICPKGLIVSLVLFTVILKITTAEEKRWSRQISNAGFLNDWIPVQPQQQQQQQLQTQPQVQSPARQAGGRVLNFGPPFGAPNQNEFNHQSPSVASATTNLGEPFQRIFLQQMHPPNLPILPQNQQQLHVTNLQSAPFRHLHEMQLNAGPQQFIFQHNAQPELKAQQFRYPQFNPPAPKPEFIRNGDSSLVQPPQQQQLVVQNDPQHLKNNILENQQPSLEMQALPPQEEVQLLYVPLDTLYNQQQDKLQNTRYNILPSPVNPLQINNFYTHHQKFPSTTQSPTGAPFKITTSTIKLRTTTPKPLHRFSFNTVTEGPTKPKSHQPPLAMFMKNSLSISNSPSVNDILSHLIFTRSIDVIDSVGGNSPSVFIGPYGLNVPEGYSKFELPYLSTLETRSDRQINMLPFFVAPLSYRVPKGFAKIPLPSPHVGSIIVNSPNSIQSVNSYDEKPFFYQSSTTTRKPVQQHFGYSTPSPVPVPERSRTTSRFRFGGEVSKPSYQNEPTTTPSSLTSFSTFKTTPTFKTQQNEGLFQQSVAGEFDEPSHFGNKYHTTGIFGTAVPQKPNSQPTIDNNYRLKDEGPSKYSLTNSQPQINATAFTFKNEEPQSVFGNYFTQTPTASFFNTPEPIITTKQPEAAKFEVTNFDEPQRYSPYLSSTPLPTSASSNTAAPARDDEKDEIEKMKSYFREQEAFKVRNPISTPAAYYENYETSSAGTIATEKGYNEFSTIPSKLTYFSKEPKQHHTSTSNVATTPRTTITYYTASSASDGTDTSNEQDIPRIKGHQPVHQFRFVNSVLENGKDNDNRIHTTSKPETKYNQHQHESLQYNEIYNTSPQFETTRTPYRERPTVSPLDENTAIYNIPSELELSPVNVNAVNALMEKDGNTTPYVTLSTTSTLPVTTRRSPVSRVRTRPPTTPRTHLADDGSVNPEITTRRPARGRRPINYANRTTTIRTTTPRSPNRVRFNSASEDRTRASTRTRARINNNNNRPAKEEENIDYQRDVLKQNYPIISKQNGTKSIETNIDQPNRVFSYTRETTIAPLIGPFDQVKIEKNVEVSYSEKESTVPDKYFGFKDSDGGARNQNQLLQKEPETPQFVSTTTFTSIQNDENQEEITEVLKTRKPSFIRRVPSSTVRSVTTQRNSAQSEYDASRTKERNSVRQKNWQQQESSSSAPRVVKPRLRNKRPFIATTTASPTTEVNTDQSFQQVNSFNKDFYKESSQSYSKKTANDTKSTSEKRKNQFRFSLNAEESQWSTKFNANSFQPLSISEKPKVLSNSPEVEIVTAAPMSDTDKETYSFNVQANFFDFNKNNNKENDSNTVNTITTTTAAAPTTTTTTAAAAAQSPPSEINNIDPDSMIYGNELSKINVNRVVGGIEENGAQQNSQSQKSKLGGTADESNTKPEKKGRRRGVWKRVRVRPVDSFETAESQNIGKQLYNTIIGDNIKEFGERNNKKSVGQRIISSPSAYAYEETLTFSDDTNGQNEENNDEVQTILPIQTTEPSKFAEFDATTIENEVIPSNEDTTEPIEKDERELEATSTVSYESDDSTTTVMPFMSSEIGGIEILDKSTEKASPTLPTIEKTVKSDIDQITEPTSIMDEVKQKLTELFSFDDDDVVVSTTERVFKINRNFKRPKSPLYTSIDRKPSVNDIVGNDDKDVNLKDVKSSPTSMKLEPVPVLKTILRPITEPSSFHRELMDSVIYATSTSTEISHETEICYRGRCVKTQKKP